MDTSFLTVSEILLVWKSDHREDEEWEACNDFRDKKIFAWHLIRVQTRRVRDPEGYRNDKDDLMIPACHRIVVDSAHQPQGGRKRSMTARLFPHLSSCSEYVHLFDSIETLTLDRLWVFSIKLAPG